MNTFEELFLKIQPELLRRALLLCRGDRDQAEDLVQDCALRGFTSFDTYDAGKPFEPWIRRVLIRLHLDAVRARRSAPATISFEEANSEDLTYDPDAWSEGCFDVLDALSRLRPEYAIVVYRVLSTDELLDRLSRVRLCRARKELRQALSLG